MAEPANRQTNPAGGKYYVHPLTNERFDSVTTILDLVDKAALKIWAGMVAADYAVDNLPAIWAAQMVEKCGNTNNKCHLKHGRGQTCERCPCGRCERCWWRRIAWRHEAESNRRSQEGTEVHEAVNAWILGGGARISLRPEVRPYMDQFHQWVTDYGLHPNGPDGAGSWEQTEVTLLNRQHGYAGTSDGAVWIRRGASRLADEFLDRVGGGDAELIRVDYKTREKPDERLYYDMPLQAVAYERCEVAMLPDGSEFPAPSTWARAVLQLRPESYTFKAMLSDDDAFMAFLGVLTAYRWINGVGKKPFDPPLDLLPIRASVSDAALAVMDVAEDDPAGVDFATVQEAIAEGERWSARCYLCEMGDPHEVHRTAQEHFAGTENMPDGPDPLDSWLSEEEPPLPDLPPLPPVAQVQKARVQAAIAADEIAANAELIKTAGSVTTATMSSKFKVGSPQLALLDEPLPF